MKSKHLLTSFCNNSRTCETHHLILRHTGGLLQGYCCPRLSAHQSSQRHPVKLSLRFELPMCVNLGVLPTKQLLGKCRTGPNASQGGRLFSCLHLQSEFLENTGGCSLSSMCLGPHPSALVLFSPSLETGATFQPSTQWCEHLERVLLSQVTSWYQGMDSAQAIWGQTQRRP